jgi:hypothetical protein
MNMCKEHGKKVKLEQGKLFCWYCRKEIPVDKLKKK